MRRRSGQTQIIAADIDTSRRQVFIFAQGSSVSVVTGAWSILAPLAATVQSSLDAVDSELRDHFTAAGRRHPATAIDFAAHGILPAGHVQGALAKLVDDLTSGAAGNSGATRVGVDAAAGAPNALPAGTVKAQLASLLGFVNAHVGAVSGAHSASAIGVIDAGGLLNGVNVESAIAEIAGAFAAGHQRGNEATPGLHKTIRQPVLAGSKALLWESAGNGACPSRFRVLTDSEGVWFTLNAGWDGAQWVRDDTGDFAGGFYLSRYAFVFVQDSTFDATFMSWQRQWRLPTAGGESALETSGPITESGRLGAAWSNPSTASASVAAGGSVSFRSRFAATPSSITTSVNYYTVDSAQPTLIAATRDGFGFFGYRTLNAGQYAFWMGTYTATA